MDQLALSLTPYRVSFDHQVIEKKSSEQTVITQQGLAGFPQN